jgi:SAM-dependent methyltransferase
MSILSPLTGSTNVRKVKDVPSKSIINFYEENLKVDISKYFKGLENISIYECLDSGYKFYYPFTLAGNGEFYEQLQKHPWYYMDWKWEHQKALEVLGGAKNLLEIGCGRGEFIEKVQKSGISCIGLELNEDAAVEGNKKGVKILNESIEEYSKSHQNEFDVVCSFQVVEHISNVGEFIKASIDCLKPGGKLIICVPNNDSVLYKIGMEIYLNMPPHHMGMWDTNSLIKLPRFFPIEVDSVYLEPLQSYHAWFAKSVAETKFKEKLDKKKLDWIPFLKKFGDRMINMTVRAVSEHIIGHSIMVVYTKK